MKQSSSSNRNYYLVLWCVVILAVLCFKLWGQDVISYAPTYSYNSIASSPFSIVNTTNQVTDTNRITITGAGTAAANSTYRWNGSTMYTNGSTLMIYFDATGPFWHLTNSVGNADLYYTGPPVDSTDVNNFPFVWNQLDGASPDPTGNFLITNQVVSAVGQPSFGYFPLGLYGLSLSGGSANIGVNSFVAQSSSANVGGGSTTNYGLNSVILGGTQHTLSRASITSFIIGGNTCYVDAQEGGLIGCANNSTNIAFGGDAVGIGYDSLFIDSSSADMVASGGASSRGNIQLGFMAGSFSTNAGTRVEAVGDYLSITNVISASVFGQRITVTGGTNVVIVGSGISSTKSNVTIVGVTNNTLFFETNTATFNANTVVAPSITVSGSGGISAATNSTLPSSTTIIRAWISVTNNGVVYKLPLYL